MILGALAAVWLIVSYGTLGDMWEGFLKWIYSVASLSPVAIIALIAAGCIFFLAPFYWLWNDLFVAAGPVYWRAAVIGQVTLIFFMRGLLGHHFKEPAISTVLHPLGFSFLVLSAVYGTIRWSLGAGVHWKKRLYGRESCVE